MTIALFIAKDGINLDDRKIGYCTLLLCIFTLNAAFSVVIKKNKLQSPNFATPFFLPLFLAQVCRWHCGASFFGGGLVHARELRNGRWRHDRGTPSRQTPPPMSAEIESNSAKTQNKWEGYKTGEEKSPSNSVSFFF